jgi:asparagine synthase (glutamine-hydrolysing)
VTVSGLLAGVCQAPHLLRHGLWPVNPLGAPDLVAFCHRLPKESRHGRAIMRRYLHGRLGEEVFPVGYVKETFAKVLSDLISREANTIAAQLQECALADLGLVDQRAVLALLDEVSTARTKAAMAPLANFLWLERLARQVAS